MLTAATFMFAAVEKFVSQPDMVALFGQIGLRQGFRYLTAAIESVGAIFLLWARTVMGGVFLLLGNSGGALVAQWGPLHGDIIHVIVLAGMVMAIGFMEWRSGWRLPF